VRQVFAATSEVLPGPYIEITAVERLHFSSQAILLAFYRKLETRTATRSSARRVQARAPVQARVRLKIASD